MFLIDHNFKANEVVSQDRLYCTKYKSIKFQDSNDRGQRLGCLYPVTTVQRTKLWVSLGLGKAGMIGVTSGFSSTNSS